MIGLGAMAAGAAIGGAIQGGANMISQNWAQNFEKEEAEKSRDWSTSERLGAQQFNADQAQLARDFSERMSNTAYQRQVADMEKAGINPALMNGLGGASMSSANAASSSTGGSASTATGSAISQNGLGNIFSSAMAATAQQNIAEFGNNVKREIAQMQDLRNAEYNSAMTKLNRDKFDYQKKRDTHNDIDSSYRYQKDYDMKERYQDFLEWKATHKHY